MTGIEIRTFGDTLARHGLTLARSALETLQVNTGKLCNQACLHCHVEAGPKRTELMDRRTVDRLLELLAPATGVHTVDITGGAPELNVNFRHLVLGARRLGRKVIDRCNLSVFFEPGQEDTPRFLSEHGVHVIASLPCYTPGKVDWQRGTGVFDKSIRALQSLNRLGYGCGDSGLALDLVYNPLGGALPGLQAALERDYKRHLGEAYGIRFDRLFTMTNMPIKRLLHDLERQGRLEEYMALLVEHFNPQAAHGVMCRSLLSVGWDGVLYDCDFNQMLNLGQGGRSRSIWDIESLREIDSVPIATGDHCYGCTAGAGSSCAGALGQG